MALRQKVRRARSGYPLGVPLGVAVLTLLVTLATLALLGRSTSAGPNIWTSIGPQSFTGIAARDEAGNVYAVQSLLSGGYDASTSVQPPSLVYRSSDGGQTWVAAGNYASAGGAHYTTEVNLLSASADGSVLMLAVRSDKGQSLLKSTDSGATWRLLRPNLEFYEQYSRHKITIHPTDATRMYTNGRDGLYRTTDGGASWQQALLGSGWVVAVDPGNPARLLAMTSASVRVSDDYGATWRAPENRGGVVPALGQYGATLLFVRGQGGQSYVLAASSGFQQSEGVVYISKDGGSTWARVSSLSNSRVLGLDASQGRMYALVRTYTPGSPQDTSPVQATDTLWTSTDGDNWTPASRALLRRSVEDLTYSVAFGRFQGLEALYVSRKDAGRIFRNDGTFSPDGGRNWQTPPQSLPLSRHFVSSLARTSSGWLVGSGQMLFRSTNSGAPTKEAGWDLLYQGADFFYSDVRGAGMSGDTVLLQLYPARVTGGPGGHYGKPPAVLRSTDGGVKWSAGSVLNTNGGHTRFTFAGADGRTVYAASSPNYFYGSGSETSRDKQGGLYKSTDGGANWGQLNVGMVVNNVLVDPADANHVWAAGDDGMAESRNGGATWTPVRTNPQVGGLILNEPHSSTFLYAFGAGGFNSGPPGRGGGIIRGLLYKSTDGGRTWNPLRIEGAPAQYGVRSLTIGGPDHIVVSWSSQQRDYPAQLHPQGYTAQVSESRDGGRTWRTLNGFGLGDLYSGATLEVDPASGTALTTNGYLMSYKVAEDPADPAFRSVWQRQDEPVQRGVAQRSWTWGPRAFATMREPLEGLPGNNRLVQYYDKSRMEINDPGGDRNSPHFVTNGLLTVEMVAGRVQVGLNRWELRAPARIPVAGDASNVDYTPSYASFRGVASYESGNNTVPNRVGAIVSQSIDAGGTVGAEVPASPQVRLAVYDAQAGHNIAAPFWEFLNRRGQVLENGRYVERPIFGDWVTVMGRPITEPYWARMRVGGKSPWVLIQLFERRVLTYTPENPREWQVEMGNVGLHYYVWRYGEGR